MTASNYDTGQRDMVGYGRSLPSITWPDGARIAVQFVLNYEEGGEYCLLNGDDHSESYLSEIVGTVPRVNGRDMNIESIYEYGSRAGFWRLWRLFSGKKVPLTVYAVGKSLEMNPEAAQAMVEANWEVAGHAYRWIDYHDYSIDEERNHLKQCIEVIRKLTGQRPQGWYTGRVSPNTRQLIAEDGGFLYYSDSYADDLPYYVKEAGKQLLTIPYALDTNDFRYLMPQGFNTGNDFFNYVKDAFDYLYEEGARTPKMLSIGLHSRISGRPGRTQALSRLVDYISSHKKVWLARRIDIARYWIDSYPVVSKDLRPRKMIRMETERLILRDYVISDLEDVHKWMSNPEVMHYLDWKTNTIEETKKNFLRTINDIDNPDRKEYYFAIIEKKSRKHIGGAGFAVKDRQSGGGVAELGYFLSKEYWEKGIALEAVSEIIEFGFRDLNLHKISASCDSDNKASEKIMLKCGLSKEGELKQERFHFNQWRDRLLYCILKDEWKNRNMLKTEKTKRRGK